MRSRTRKHLRVLGVTGGLGLVAGLRSFTAPAALALAEKQRWVPRRGPARWLRSSPAFEVAAALAAGEMIVDKTRVAPDRRVPLSLAWRIASGAFVGGSLCAAKKEPIAVGATAGALTALAGTFAGFHFRRMLKQRIPSRAAAVAEDAVAVGSGLLLASVSRI